MTDRAKDADEARYRASLAALERERAKLAEALGNEDRTAIAWALRSAAAMLKWLIDIDPDFPERGRSLAEGVRLADQVHAVQRASR